MTRAKDMLGRLLGAPVIHAFGWIYDQLRERAYADLAGRHYQYKTNPIDIADGSGGARWLSVADVRRTIKGLPRFELLCRTCPDGVRVDDRGGFEQIEARALWALLAKAQDDETLRFRHWLQRQVIFPAQTQAARAQQHLAGTEQDTAP